ncbi:hypothetical protein BBJ28_00004269 [Nothophytophthora sp. Chile5]|nr:hypothetical protein BBJ28_00004269 [Nothophytophthora sp. Chile5]
MAGHSPLAEIETVQADADDSLVAALMEFVLNPKLAQDSLSAEDMHHLSYTVPVPDAPSVVVTCRVASVFNEVGLKLWEAGWMLAEYVLAHDLEFRDKTVLELGAGVGFTGLVLACACRAKRVMLTDYAPNVMQNLRYNVEVNASKFRCPVEVQVLDWDTWQSDNDVDNQPDVLLAGDCVYDVDSFPSLMRVLQGFLGSKTQREAIFASTIRNQKTFQAFLDQLETHRILYVDITATALEAMGEQLYAYENREQIRLCRLSRSGFDDAPACSPGLAACRWTEPLARATGQSGLLPAPPSRHFSFRFAAQAVTMSTKLLHDVETGRSSVEFDPLGTPDMPKDEFQLSSVDDSYIEAPGASLPTLLAISMPRMAIRMAWAAQWAALGPYLQTLLPRYAVQLTQIIGPLTGILVGPTIGVFSDRSTSKYGRRRPFLVVAAVGSIVCWTLMGFTREMGDAMGDVGSGRPGEVTDRSWTTAFMIFFYLWMDVTINIAQTPVLLLIADFAGPRQTTGAALGQGWSTLGAIVVAGYIQIFGAAYNSLHYFLGMLSLAIAVCVTIACLAARETPLKRIGATELSTFQTAVFAFRSIVTGLRSLPGVLTVFALIFFLNQYAFTAYNGSKGQFFGLEVFDGNAANAATCGDACSEAQLNYNHGVRLAGGLADLLFSIVGYLYSWLLPLLVRRYGAQRVVTFAALPQALLMVMAFSDLVALDVAIVATTSITLCTLFPLVVPLVIHVFGRQADIGMHVGAINSANCFGQLLNYAVGAALVETSLGFKLPVFVGGAVSLLAFIVSAVCFRTRMNSM